MTRMENPKPSSFLVSAVDAACNAAMHLKRSKKEPFTCLILRVERGKQPHIRAGFDEELHYWHVPATTAEQKRGLHDQMLGRDRPRRR